MSASGDDASRWLEVLNQAGSIDDLDNALTRLLFLPIIAFFAQAANAVEAITNLFIVPVNSFVNGLGGIVGALLGAPANIISTGGSISAENLAPFGIAGFPIGLAVAFAGAFIIIQFLQQGESSDLIPFSFTDFPLIGTDEEGEQ